MHLFGKTHPKPVCDFDDIRSYTDEETVSALRELADDNVFLETVSSYFLSDKHPLVQFLARRKTSQKLAGALRSVTGVADFQRKIIYNLVIREIIRRTVSSFHCSGFENLDPNGRYIFMSNHRDIVCDAAFFEACMIENGLPATEIAFGSNLLVNKLVETLIRCNRGCIVYRGLDMRAQYEEYMKLSAYIRKLMDENRSLWIAHRQGRSKDASHLTNPAVLKMFYLSQRESGYSFAEYLNFCKIVPVSVSYERDPAVVLMAETLVCEEKEGDYRKSPNEDLNHIMRGLTGYKGEVHINVGTPIDFLPFGKNAEAAAAAIDRFIHSHLVPGPFHYLAYDRMYHTDKFAPMYADDDEAEFDMLYGDCAPGVYKKILLQYSNPVKAKSEAEGKSL